MSSVFLIANTAQAEGTSRIEFRTNQKLALHWWVRAQAELHPDLQAPQAAAAIEAMAMYQAYVGSRQDSPQYALPQLFWRSFDALLVQGLDVHSAHQRSFRAEPEDIADYAKALEDLRPWYDANIWPAAKEQLDETIALSRQHLAPHVDAMVKLACKDFGMQDPGLVIPVYLFPTGPRPGGITVRTKAGPLCLVAIDTARDCLGGSVELLFDAIMHEALHALDAGTQDQDTHLNQLRKHLIKQDQQKHARNAAHMVLFAESGRLIRQFISPDHRSYGELCRVYRKDPSRNRPTRDAWLAFVHGDTDLATMFENVSRALRKADTPPTTQPAGPPTTQPSAE